MTKPNERQSGNWILFVGQNDDPLNHFNMKKVSTTSEQIIRSVYLLLVGIYFYCMVYYIIIFIVSIKSMNFLFILNIFSQ